VVFLDDDDELLPDMLRISREAVLTSLRPAPVSALSGITVVNEAGDRIEERLPISLNRGDLYLAAGDFRALQDANTLFAPVETLRMIGGWNEALRGWEIEDLFLRLTRVISIEGVPIVTYRLNHHGGPRLTTDSLSMIHGAERTLDEYRDLFEAFPKRRGPLFPPSRRAISKGGSVAARGRGPVASSPAGPGRTFRAAPFARWLWRTGHLSGRSSRAPSTRLALSSALSERTA
jgi:hypothetical protein